MDKLVTLHRVDITFDSLGGPVSSWEVMATVWGEWKPTGGKEAFIANAVVSQSGGTMVIRYREDIDTSWRVGFEGKLYEVIGDPVRVGRASYLALTLQVVPPTEITFPLVNVFEVRLVPGTASKLIRFPAAFATEPRGLYLQLMLPDGSASFDVTAEDVTASGFTAEFSALVPSSGYVLSVQAFQNKLVYTADLTEGESTLVHVYEIAFPSKPRGLKVSLLPPDGGYEFTTAINVTSPSATGFTADFGALVPGPGYRVLIQVSL